MTVMGRAKGNYRVGFADSAAEVAEAQNLRYRVFIEELKGDSRFLDHKNCREIDPFDAHATHLILRDTTRAKGDQVVGTYRLILSNDPAAGAFSSQAEFDLTPLMNQPRRLLELSRSCIHPDYRDGMAMFMLWQVLAGYVQQHDIDVLFGVASFHGRDPLPIVDALSLLHHAYLAPKGLRPISRAPAPFDLIPEAELDRKAALLKIPALIKAYLRMGGGVGEGAYIDAAFNTVDVCMVMDVTKVSDRQRAIYTKAPQ